MKNTITSQQKAYTSVDVEVDALCDQFSSVHPRMPQLGWPLLKNLQYNTLATWAHIHTYGDAVRINMLGRAVHFLFHPALIRAVLMQDEQEFNKENRQVAVFKIAQGMNVLTAHGADWKRQRRILNPAFAPKRVAGYMNLMTQAAHDVNAFALPQQVGVSKMLDAESYTTRLTMDVILRVLFSQRMPPAQVASISASVRQLAQQGMRMLFWPFIPPAWFPYLGRRNTVRSRALLSELIIQHIQTRRTTHQTTTPDTAQDLLHVMLDAKDEDAIDGMPERLLSTQEIEDNCMAIFLAGHDTSATALAWWMGFMAMHPAACERARREVLDVLGTQGTSSAITLTPEHIAHMPWLDASLKEAMRLRPPITAPFMRQAQHDSDIHGVHIRTGDMVSMPIWQMHHDARWFPDPKSFNPERFLVGAPEIPRGAWMPFGTGPHVCIGQHFAMSEMKMLAALLLVQVRWTFNTGDSLPDPHMDIVLKPERPILLKVEKI